MEIEKECKICGNTMFDHFMEVNDYFLTNEKFNLVKCKNCELVFVNPRPSHHDIAKYYNSPNYISHSGTNKGIINWVYTKIRNYTHQKKLKLVSTFSSGKTILDIGCGSGELLFLFKKNNWDTLGVEPNDNARTFSQKQYQLNVLKEEEIDQIGSHSKDVISMWHVLEHVHDLNKRLIEIKRILKNNGVVFIAVPNMESFDATSYNAFWAAYDVPRHLYHFTPATMRKLLEKHHFLIHDIIPMKFDSFYVSMLSEKYKTGKNKLLKAFITGMRSNMKANNKNHAYSSLIYVVKNS